MAVTAHWIEAKTSTRSTTQQPQLALRADLIGFIHVPGRHTGEHLAHALLRVLDRIHITEKVMCTFYIHFPLNLSVFF
jgi:hypothetical protein